MGLKFKANLTGFFLVAIITLSVSALAVWTIDHLTETLNLRLLDKEIDEYRDKIAESREVLESTGLLGVRDYVDLAQSDLLSSFEERAPKMFGKLSIVSSGGMVVMHEGRALGEKLDLPCLDKLLATESGKIDCLMGDEERIGPYLLIPEWDWLLVVTISAEQMRQTRNEFLMRVAVIFVIASILGWWSFIRAARGVLDPVLDLSKAAAGIGQGDWSAIPSPLPRNDEIGDLSRNFVTMARRLRDSQADLTSQAHSLRQSNIRLEKEIEERIRVEQDLRKATSSFMGIFDSSPSVLIGVDLHCVVTHWNRAACQQSGLEPPQVIGLPLELALPRLVGLADTVRRSMADQISVMFSRQPYNKDGETRQEDILIRPLVSDTTYGAVIRLDDVTSRIRLEEGLIAARKNAETANEAKSEFLANMSHELRTPFSAIKGMMQLLEGTQLDDEQRRYVSMANQASQRFTRLLTDLLDISRVEAGRLDILEQEFRVDDLQDSVIEIFALAAQEKGIFLEYVVDPAMPPKLVGDEMRVRQILFNLVGNAIKFTEKGSVRIEISPVSPPTSPKQRVLISVLDTGIGIPASKLNCIFESFVQVDGAASRSFQGAGLGLAIVKRLVTLLGGRIYVESVEGEGTAMHVLLPFTAAEADTQAAQEFPRTASTDNSLHVLLVEDEPIISLYTRKLLEKHGHKVTTAENGLQIFNLSDTHDFDCILMDIQMPVMDGMETTRAIRSSTIPGFRKDIPIIALTAHAMIGDREKFLDSGMDGYLTKPVNMNEMAAVLGNITPIRFA